MDWLAWIPEPASLDLWVWGLLVVPAVLLGVPLILAGVRVPRHLILVEVPDDELTPGQRRWFEQLGETLRGAGFERAATFQAPELPSRNLSRAFRGGLDGSVAIAMALRDEREGTVLSEQLLEFNSEFGDGSLVNTRSRAVTDLFDLLPGSERHIHQTRDPLALHRHHERHCRRHLAAGVRAVAPRDLLAHMSGFHERWIAHQIARGLLRPRDERWCGATVRLALRGVLAFFNPFGDRFSPLRLLAGLAAGAGMPLLAALALGHPEVPVVALVQDVAAVSAHTAEILALAPAVLLAAAGVGFIFESRAVVWSPLLASLVGGLALPASIPDADARLAWLLVLLCTPAVANGVSNLRHRRQALV